MYREQDSFNAKPSNWFLFLFFVITGSILSGSGFLAIVILAFIIIVDYNYNAKYYALLLENGEEYCKREVELVRKAREMARTDPPTTDINHKAPGITAGNLEVVSPVISIASTNEIAGNISAEISSKLADPDTIVTI